MSDSLHRWRRLAANWLPWLAATAIVAIWLRPASDSRPPLDTELSARSILAATAGGGNDGFERALEPPQLSFPRDHGAHPSFQNEWWYFTGNVSAAGGEAFGYQLTLFRRSLLPREPELDSDWASRESWMAHFALSDASVGRHYAFERFSRGALGLAGVEQTDAATRVSVGPWQAVFEDGSLRLTAAEEDCSIDLALDPAKPITLQGDRGLSQKGSSPGNASHYYSYTRLDTLGRIRVGERELQVSGHSWMDREWSTSALEPEQVGWDWFALQLDDGREWMLYRMRREDGELDPHSSGTWVQPDGESVALTASEFDVQVLSSWRSPESGARYPSAWRLESERLQLSLEVEPLFADQELRLRFRYWEGAVRFEGTCAGEPVRGRGYVELVGYP